MSDPFALHQKWPLSFHCHNPGNTGCSEWSTHTFASPGRAVTSWSHTPVLLSCHPAAIRIMNPLMGSQCEDGRRSPLLPECTPRDQGSWPVTVPCTAWFPNITQSLSYSMCLHTPELMVSKSHKVGFHYWIFISLIMAQCDRSKQHLWFGVLTEAKTFGFYFHMSFFISWVCTFRRAANPPFLRHRAHHYFSLWQDIEAQPNSDFKMI